MSLIQSRSFVLFYVALLFLVVCLPSLGEECFETYIPERGIFFAEASVPAESTAQPRLKFSGLQGSELTRGKSFKYLDRLATSLVVEVNTPGEYVFCVGAQNSEADLGRVKITRSFSALIPIMKDDDPDVVVDEPDTTPKAQGPEGGALRLRLAMADLCVALQADDHGDVLRCATELAVGQDLRAALDSHDDEDVFAVHVEDLATLRLESRGDVEISPRLYDRFGQQLYVEMEDRVDHQTGEAGWRIIKTLSPGVYFLKVSARFGGQGTYLLKPRLLKP